jgi:hypothetical protein
MAFRILVIIQKGFKVYFLKENVMNVTFILERGWD